MKNVWILLLLVGVSASAQRMNPKGDVMKNFSPEETATLKTKRLSLMLALDQNQQDQVYELELERAKNRRNQIPKRENSGKNKLSKEERFEKANKRLDAQIDFQRKMQQILNKEQFNLWRKMRHKKARKQREPKARGHNRG